MLTFRDIRQRFSKRGPVLGRVPALAHEIKSGQLRPEDLSLDNDRQETPLTEDRAKTPWYDIGGFWRYVKERRERINLGAARKKQLRSPEEVNQVQNMDLPDSPLPNPVEAGDGAPLEQVEQITDRLTGNVVERGDDPVLSLPEPSTKTVRRDEVENTQAGQLVASTVPSDTSTELATIGEGSDLEALLEAQYDIAADNGQSDLGLIGRGMPGCISPRTLEWHSSAVTIKDGQDVEQSEKVMYDTGAVPNLSTPKFASTHNLKERPLLPDDMVTYTTPIGPVTPTHYIELQMKDPKHGINKFVTVQLLMVAALDGFGLLLGRGFMTQYRVVLDPSQGSDMYPVIARAPGPGRLPTFHVRRNPANVMK
jgi:hypothetical protein